MFSRISWIDISLVWLGVMLCWTQHDLPLDSKHYAYYAVILIISYLATSLTSAFFSSRRHRNDTLDM